MAAVGRLDLRADLHEHHLELGQGVAQGGAVLAEAVLGGVEHGGHGVDREAGLVEVGLGLAEVDGGELVEADDVVGHELGGRGREDLALDVGHLGDHRLGLGPLLGAERVEVGTADPAGHTAVGGGAPRSHWYLATRRPQAHQVSSKLSDRGPPRGSSSTPSGPALASGGPRSLS